MNCYCDSSNNFSHCCEPYLFGYDTPVTAEQLMRSRYTAFCLNQYDYLNQTSSVPMDGTPDTSTQWTKLTIINTANGGHNDSKGTVEFNAFYTNEQQLYVHHEISYFKKHNGQWLYVGGTPTITNISPTLT